MIRKVDIPNKLPLTLTIEQRIETLLRTTLSTIELLNDNIYPLFVHESVKPPYLVYSLVDGTYLKTLDGEQPWDFNYEVSILASRYEQLKVLEQSVREALLTLKGGVIGKFAIQDIEVSVPIETYEDKVNLQRANIELTIKF